LLNLQVREFTVRGSGFRKEGVTKKKKAVCDVHAALKIAAEGAVS
jgi:hypothetical protein